MERSMESNSIFSKSFSRCERMNLGYGALCLIVLFSFFTVFRPSFNQLQPILINLQLNMSSDLHMLTIKNTSVSRILNHQESQQSNILQYASQRLEQEENLRRQHQHKRISNSTSISQTSESEKKKEHKLLCNLMEPRSDFCEMNGDIRIHGNSSTIFVAAPQVDVMARNESWRIKPYTRKVDWYAMRSVTEFSVKSLAAHSAPNCTTNHNVPAVVFSVSGYSYNYFHAFGDILVPLFITSYQFQGEVQFLVTNSNSSWISKYQEILQGLSRYEIINIDSDDRIHCFPRMIVGLKQHEEFRIDPLKSPNGYSMKDFRKFLRSTYSLKRANAIRIRNHHHKKPRLLIVSRKQTRLFTNKEEIVELATSLGYEVIVAEPDAMNLTRLARIINSCDVMMGIHGAGLTNLVFLPKNAVLIQIVPLGGLKYWCDLYFGRPVLDMDIRYLEYNIREEESTLLEQYPLDHAVFKDPSSFYKQGWVALKAVYLDKQDVKLDVRRFRATLLEALELLHR